MMKRITTILMAAMIGAALASGGVAAGDAGLRIGVLKCKKSGPKTNLLIHSVAPFECVFKGDGGSEKYKGESGVGLGIDLKWDKTSEMIYTVLSATAAYKIGSNALAGKYVGAKASVAVGVGGGAQVLVGGGKKNITLQPIALEGGSGLGAAAGAGYLFLEPLR